MTLGERLAREAQERAFSDLSDGEVHATKRAILDTLACGVGGFEGLSSQIIRAFVKARGGPEESTVLGGGFKVGCAEAALANGAMVRYLDFNDTYLKVEEGFFGGWHPSELIPAVLSVGERQRAGGEEVINAVSLGYGVIGRFVDGITKVPLSGRGWHMGTLAGFVVPLQVGKLLGLDAEQMVHAMGIAGSYSPTLGILDAHGEAYNMTKNIGVPRVARDSITATLLAQEGFTGPRAVIEGNRGLEQTVLSGAFDRSALLERPAQPAVSRTIMKPFAAEFSAQGALSAVIKLVQDHDILPEQVEGVTVELTTRGAEHIGDPIKRHPRNKESADHSIYYLTAVAILDRTVDGDSYSEEKFSDPGVRDLIDRVTVEANPDLDRFGAAGIAHIQTGSGRVSCRVDYPKGHYLNPMTDGEVEDKFRKLASRFMEEGRMRRVVETIYRLEEVDDIGELMGMFVFKPKSKK